MGYIPVIVGIFLLGRKKTLILCFIVYLFAFAFISAVDRQTSPLSSGMLLFQGCRGPAAAVGVGFSCPML